MMMIWLDDKWHLSTVVSHFDAFYLVWLAFCLIIRYVK